MITLNLYEFNNFPAWKITSLELNAECILAILTNDSKVSNDKLK